MSGTGVRKVEGGSTDFALEGKQETALQVSLGR